MNRTDHLLVIVAEECAEVAQRATKALRFGLSEVQEGQPLNNAERLMEEYADLVGVIEMLQAEGHLPDVPRARVDFKKAGVERWLGHSKANGRLDGGTRASGSASR